MHVFVTHSSHRTCFFFFSAVSHTVKGPPLSCLLFFEQRRTFCSTAVKASQFLLLLENDKAVVAKTAVHLQEGRLLFRFLDSV